MHPKKLSGLNLKKYPIGIIVKLLTRLNRAMIVNGENYSQIIENTAIRQFEKI